MKKLHTILLVLVLVLMAFGTALSPLDPTPPPDEGDYPKNPYYDKDCGQLVPILGECNTANQPGRPWENPWRDSPYSSVWCYKLQIFPDDPVLQEKCTDV